MLSKLHVTDGKIVKMTSHRERYPLLAISLVPDEMDEVKAYAKRWGFANRSGPLPGGLMGAILRELWGYLRSAEFDPRRIFLPVNVKRVEGSFRCLATGDLDGRMAVLSRHAAVPSVSEYIRPAVEAFLASEQARLRIEDSAMADEVRKLRKKKTLETHR